MFPLKARVSGHVSTISKKLCRCVFVPLRVQIYLRRSCGRSTPRRIKLICQQFPKTTLCNVIRCVQGHVVYIYVYTLYVYVVYICMYIYIFYVFVSLYQCIRLYVYLYIVRRICVYVYMHATCVSIKYVYVCISTKYVHVFIYFLYTHYLDLYTCICISYIYIHTESNTAVSAQARPKGGQRPASAVQRERKERQRERLSVCMYDAVVVAPPTHATPPPRLGRACRPRRRRTRRLADGTCVGNGYHRLLWGPP